MEMIVSQPLFLLFFVLSLHLSALSFAIVFILVHVDFKGPVLTSFTTQKHVDFL